MSQMSVAASDKDLVDIPLDVLIGQGVRYACGFMQGSGGLFHTSRVKTNRWLSVARTVVETEALLGRTLTDARTVLESIRSDPFAAVTATWEDVEDPNQQEDPDA